MERSGTHVIGRVAWKLAGSCFLGLATLVGSLGVLAAAAEGDQAPARRPAPTAATFFEEDDPAVSWSGTWSENSLAANSGGSARLAMDAGAQASFSFDGTGASWIGYRDEWCGIATVHVDGKLQATVDTHSTSAKARAPLYVVSGLGEGRHSLTITATGTRNTASAGSWVWVDAFSVTPAAGPDPRSSIPSRSLAPSAGREARPRNATASKTSRQEDAPRFEQDDPAVSWIGAWSTNHLGVHSGGSARLSMETASRVSLTFTGTGVSWIGYQDEWSGIADVRLDGRLRASVDTYSTPARAQAGLYVIDGLPRRIHTLTIQPTGRRRPASGGSWIWVDAFSITR
jgi:hypothetical protein